MTDHAQAGRASRVVRDALICTRCEHVTHHIHARACPACNAPADALESALTAAAKVEHQAIADLGHGLRELSRLCSALGRCSMALAASCRQQGDDQAAVVHETRAETVERFAAWALAHSHEVSQ